MNLKKSLKVQDPEAYRMVQAEARRQSGYLEMIASENFVSYAVLETAGVQNILTKQLGSRNPNNVVKAAMNGLLTLRSKEEQEKYRVEG